MLTTRRLVALCLAGLALLGWTADAAGPIVIGPAEARLWEGQAVTIEGVARSVRDQDDGGQRFDLVADGHAVPVLLDGPRVRSGDAVRVEGRLARLGGTLLLLGDDASAARPDGPDASIADLARDPDAWLGRVAHVEGTVAKGRIAADGHSLALGDGDWPTSGAVTADVMLGYHAPCGCHRVDQVAPWTA